MTLPGTVILPFDPEAISSGDPKRLTDYMQKLVNATTNCFEDATRDFSDSRSLVYRGSFTRNLASGSGNVAYTGTGFTPNCILLIGAVSGTNVAVWGLAVGTSGYSINTPYNGTAGTYEATSNLVKVYTASGKSQSAVIKSLDPNGFTLTWTVAGSPTGTLTVYYIAMRI